MLDISDISQSSGRRTHKALSSSQSNNHNNKNKRQVRFSSVTEGPLSLGIRVFSNKEFVSLDLKDRQQVWYTGLEIRAMKQANMDHVAAAKNNKEGPSSADDDDKEEDWRGLEHMVEGETKRRQRIQHFVCAVLKIQSERQRKGSKPDAIADALGAFSRSQSRGDRRRAHNVGRLDYADAHHIHHIQQQHGLHLSSSSLFRGSSSTVRSARRNSSGLHRRVSQCVMSSQAALRRSLSEDNGSLKKKRHVLSRMSSRVRAAAMLPHKRLATPVSSSSASSLQSTGSTASVTSSS